MDWALVKPRGDFVYFNFCNVVKLIGLKDMLSPLSGLMEMSHYI